MDRRIFLRSGVWAGAVGGIVVWYLALVGMVERFDALNLVGSWGTLATVILILPPALAGALAVRPRVVAGERRRADPATALVTASVAGATTGLVVAAGVGVVNILGVETVHQVFVSVTDELLTILTFGLGSWAGAGVLVIAAAGLAVAGGLLATVDRGIRRPIVTGLAAVLALGLLQRVVPTVMDRLSVPRQPWYSPFTFGLTAVGAAAAFVLGAGVSVALDRLRDRRRRAPTGDGPADPHPLDGLRSPRSVAIVLGIVALLALPQLAGPVVSLTIDRVGIYILLGLGLNIVVGQAGLLDLGYVAFFAVGAYVIAILTGANLVGVFGLETPELSMHLSFWVAVPIVVAIAALVGVLIGAPVLRLRGDYLAIVTLGFGEIARTIFGSDLAKPLFGGAQGMRDVTDAALFGYSFRPPEHFYYLVVGLCLLAVFVSVRLQDSRIGRAWNAMREDEQVADAMGISTTRYKLLAFAIGGAVGSLGGSLFAVEISALTIKNFDIFVSITALAIVILGGLGSIRGVAVGAFVLIGVPDLLSQFEEYRLLIYGAVLIAIMVLRPEGVLPNVRRSRELHEDDRSQDKWASALEGADEDVTAGMSPIGEGSG
jgi:branched-chain amino acid transport system permease protein